MSLENKFENYAYLLDASYCKEFNLENAVELLDKQNEYFRGYIAKKNAEYAEKLQQAIDKCDYLTSGNVAHDKFYIKRSLMNLKEELEK